MRQALHQANATVMPNENIGDSAELAFVPRNCCAIRGRNCARSAQAVEFGGGGSRTEVGHVGHVCRLAGAPNPVEKHTTRLALLNFRGRFVAVEPKLNGLAFEGFIELLSRLLGLDHRFIHTGLMSGGEAGPQTLGGSADIPVCGFGRLSCRQSLGTRNRKVP